MALLIFHRVTFVSNYHKEGAERPLANLSAVNYGNLPSCLSASAAGLPFVSKSKAPICNISTFSFLQGHGAHKRLTTGDIYSRQSLRPPLQNAAHSSTWAEATTWLRSTKPKSGAERSGTGTGLCWSVFSECERRKVETMKSPETHKHSVFADVDELRMMVFRLRIVLKWHKASEKR